MTTRIKVPFGEIHITGIHICLNCEKEMECHNLAKLFCSIECLLELKKCAESQGVDANYDLDDVKGLSEKKRKRDLNRKLR